MTVSIRFAKSENPKQRSVGLLRMGPFQQDELCQHDRNNWGRSKITHTRRNCGNFLSLALWFASIYRVNLPVLRGEMWTNSPDLHWMWIVGWLNKHCQWHVHLFNICQKVNILLLCCELTYLTEMTRFHWKTVAGLISTFISSCFAVFKSDSPYSYNITYWDFYYSSVTLFFEGQKTNAFL